MGKFSKAGGREMPELNKMCIRDRPDTWHPYRYTYIRSPWQDLLPWYFCHWKSGRL